MLVQHRSGMFHHVVSVVWQCENDHTGTTSMTGGGEEGQGS